MLNACRMQLLSRNKKITAVYRHPAFFLSSMWCYPALVHLSSSVKYGRHVNQICLPDSFIFFKPGKRCIVTGWGHTSWNGSTSPVLREAWVDLAGKEACNSEKWAFFTKSSSPSALADIACKISYCPFVHFFPSSYNGTIGNNFLCAGFEEGGIDACSYDSGGPLACPVLDGDGRWMLAGIVSWGEGCALPHKYGVYTNVNEFTQWMKGAMKMDRWISIGVLFLHSVGPVIAILGKLIERDTLDLEYKYSFPHIKNKLQFSDQSEQHRSLSPTNLLQIYFQSVRHLHLPSDHGIYFDIHSFKTSSRSTAKFALK